MERRGLRNETRLDASPGYRCAHSGYLLYPFSEEGVRSAVADAMAMKTVKSTIVPWPELVED